MIIIRMRNIKTSPHTQSTFTRKPHPGRSHSPSRNLLHAKPAGQLGEKQLRSRPGGRPLRPSVWVDPCFRLSEPFQPSSSPRHQSGHVSNFPTNIWPATTNTPPTLPTNPTLSSLDEGSASDKNLKMLVSKVNKVVDSLRAACMSLSLKIVHEISSIHTQTFDHRSFAVCILSS